MGKVTFKDPVDTLSGKISKNRPTIYNLGHVGIRRGKQWTSWLGKPRDLSVNPLSTLEANARNRFKAVRLAVRAVMENDTKYMQAVVAFQAVKNQYTSFQSYLWKIEGDKYDEAQDA